MGLLSEKSGFSIRPVHPCLLRCTAVNETDAAENAFLNAYDQYADAIFRHCYFRIHHRESARELMQDAFMQTWKYIASGKKVKNLKAFLYKTANNLVIDHIRRNKRRPEVSLDAMQEQGFNPGDNSDAEETRRKIDAKFVLKALHQIKQPYRDALIMRYIDDLAPAEIAAITGETANVVSVRLNRGIKMLRALLVHV